MLLKNPPHNIPRHFVFSTSLFCMIKQNKKITNLNSNSIASTCSGKFVVMSTGGGEKYRAFQTLRELSYSLNHSKTPTSIKLERQNLSPTIPQKSYAILHWQPVSPPRNRPPASKYFVPPTTSYSSAISTKESPPTPKHFPLSMLIFPRSQQLLGQGRKANS
jgi:hypothetical protein